MDLYQKYQIKNILHCCDCPLRVYGFCSRYLWILNRGPKDHVDGCNWIDFI